MIWPHDAEGTLAVVTISSSWAMLAWSVTGVTSIPVSAWNVSHRLRCWARPSHPRRPILAPRPAIAPKRGGDRLQRTDTGSDEPACIRRLLFSKWLIVSLPRRFLSVTLVDQKLSSLCQCYWIPKPNFPNVGPFIAEFLRPIGKIQRFHAIKHRPRLREHGTSGDRSFGTINTAEASRRFSTRARRSAVT